ncbi:MAG TPA: response regulator [Streptosporangiaceae bacterium]|nr:response regulator [Streptosporangiaceae bacterium]
MGPVPVDRPVRVALVEDTDVVVEGVRTWIADDPAGRAVIVAVAGSIEAVLDGPGRDADVLVLDLELDGVMVTERVAALSDAGFRVVVFSVHVEPLIVEAVMNAGACAFLDKRTERDHFVDTIVAVAHDEPAVTPSMAGGLLQAVRLSPREREALRYLFQGMDHVSIARRLRKPSGETISAYTAKQYIERARAKFAAAGRPCRSTFALLARCIEEGLIRPEEVEDYRSGQNGP